VKADEDSDIGASMKAMVETYLNNLPNCVNRELIDKVSTDLFQHLPLFCHHVLSFKHGHVIAFQHVH